MASLPSLNFHSESQLLSNGNPLGFEKVVKLYTLRSQKQLPLRRNSASPVVYCLAYPYLPRLSTATSGLVALVSSPLGSVSTSPSTREVFQIGKFLLVLEWQSMLLLLPRPRRYQWSDPCLIDPSNLLLCHCQVDGHHGPLLPHRDQS